MSLGEELNVINRLRDEMDDELIKLQHRLPGEKTILEEARALLSLIVHNFKMDLIDKEQKLIEIDAKQHTIEGLISAVKEKTGVDIA